MSIALLIGNGRPEKEELIPIATEEAFNHIWEPAFKDISVKWLQRFPDGFSVAISSIPEIISELRMIEAWFKKNLSESEARQLSGRIDAVVLALQEAIGIEQVDIWIG